MGPKRRPDFKTLSPDRFSRGYPDPTDGLSSNFCYFSFLFLLFNL